jgi:DNA-binding SARP family transcriptional activator
MSRPAPALKHNGVIRPSSRNALSLLDAFELRCEGRVVRLPMTAQRLLAFIALHEHPLLRPYVAGVLWTDASVDRAAGNLRSSLWRLRRPGYRLVDATATHLELAPSVDVDVRRAMAMAHHVMEGTADCASLNAPDLHLDAELLPDWYEDWVSFRRERFRQLGLHALEALAERQMTLGRLGHALEAALAAVHSEPLRESAHRTLIRVHLAEGNASEALRQYELCKYLLRDRLSLEPSPHLEALVRPLTRSTTARCSE